MSWTSAPTLFRAATSSCSPFLTPKLCIATRLAGLRSVTVSERSCGVMRAVAAQHVGRRPFSSGTRHKLRPACVRVTGSCVRHRYSTAMPPAGRGETSLTWNRFLTLRKTRRRISLAASVATCAVATAGGMVYLSQSDFDRLASQAVGLDPMIVLGLATFGFAGLGWLAGPFAGSAIFNVAHRSIKPEMMKKEKDFFNRIKKHRVDPANSSIQNPVPDFYGEKIGSVAGYRTWLRDQRAFRLKRSGGSLSGARPASQ